MPACFSARQFSRQFHFKTRMPQKSSNSVNEEEPKTHSLKDPPSLLTQTWPNNSKIGPNCSNLVDCILLAICVS